MLDDAALDDLLSVPPGPLVEAMSRVEGDLVILGAGGKMGPSLARLARRASEAAGIRRRVVAVSRFGDPAQRRELGKQGVETVACDLFDRRDVDRLPDSANVMYLVGQKFGTSDDEPRTWAINAYLPAAAAERYRGSRLVAFSTGNVYPLTATTEPGPDENHPPGPIGEYAWSALARERVFEFFSRRHGTPMAILRLNYAVEPRYGVLRDIADQVRSRRPVDLRMPKVNVIWQRDANAIALRALEHCAVPPLVLNLTGPAVSVRRIAEAFGRRWGVDPDFDGDEAPTALLSDPSRCAAIFGPPDVAIEEMIERVAEWVEQGGRSLGKPTHFEMREGRF